MDAGGTLIPDLDIYRTAGHAITGHPDRPGRGRQTKRDGRDVSR